MIGLAGAHRTGKTSLAKVFAAANDVPFIETSTSAVFEALGFDPKIDYDFKIRMMIQNKILDVAEALWRKAPAGDSITDRTPIDMLSYTMADVQRENLDADDVGIFMDYYQRCINSTNRHFSMIVVVQPGIELVDADGKGPLNMAYMEHINNLAIGLLNDSRIASSRYVMGRNITSLEKRLDTLERMLSRSYTKHQEVVAKTGVSIH